MTAICASYPRKPLFEIAAFEELADDIIDDPAPDAKVALIFFRIDPLEFRRMAGHKFVERRLGRPAGLVELPGPLCRLSRLRWSPT